MQEQSIELYKSTVPIVSDYLISVELENLFSGRENSFSRRENSLREQMLGKSESAPVAKY